MLSIPAILKGQSINFTFTTDDNNYCNPVEVKFTQSANGYPVGYLWDFGDGGHSNSANPKYLYTTPGIYTVRLIAVYDNHTAEISRTVTINPSINTAFTVDRDNICQPGILHFTATSSGLIANYQWDFGDGTAPVISNSSAISHSFSTYGDYTVTLSGMSANGCSSGFSRTVSVQQPVINGTLDIGSGCIPVTTRFNASVLVQNGSGISSYQWNFGDGNSLSTSISQASHTYLAVGTFFPTLTITTIDGCTASFAYDSVAYGISPTNHIAYSRDTVVCGSETPQFVSKAFNATSYNWDFGGGNLVSVTDTLTEHKFSQLGIRDITVTPMFNGCAGTSVDLQIKIVGVIATYNYRNTCNDKKTFEVSNTSQGNLSSTFWNMGDGTSSGTTGNFIHTYAASGAFPLKLVLGDNITGCVDSLTRIIYTADPILVNPDQSICINTNTNYILQHNYGNPAAQYTWNVVGIEIGPDSNSSLTINANILGHFSNNFVIVNNGISYCPDTIILNHPIIVKGPLLDFNAPENLCVNRALEVVNLSHPFQPADSVRLWIWNFGKVAKNDTVFQPLPYSYFSPRIYKVKLTAIDINGCMDSLVKNVRVRPVPFLWIIPKLDTVCLGQNTTLVGYTSDNILWSSTANQNFCTSCDTTIVTPTTTSKYFASATNVFGCVSTDSSSVKVFAPFNAFAIRRDTGICSGEKVVLDVEPKMKRVIWAPDVNIPGNTSYNPEVFPKRTTVYTATLSDSAGCFSSTAEVKINVYPLPAVNAGPDKMYIYNTSFTLNPTYSSNITSWLWSPSDSLSCANCISPNGVAKQTQTYTVTVTSDSGCIAKDVVTVVVNPNVLMPTAFTPNNDGLNDLYRPMGRGIKSIKSFSIYNREGQIIYQAKDFYPSSESSAGWNGKFKGQDQSAAAYLYMVEAVSESGQTIVTKGSFVLIR